MYRYLWLGLAAVSLSGCVGSLAGTDANIYPLGVFGQKIVGKRDLRHRF
jgi:hypothetical protein